MSLEQSINELKISIDHLIGSFSNTNFQDNSQQENVEEPSDTVAPEKSTGQIATRKQYIFFKDNNSGAVLEKGDQVPVDNGATGVNKVTFEKLAKKHGFDPETGQAIAASTEPDPVDDDLEDLNAVASDPAPEPDEFDLDGDDENQLTEADVKGALMKFIEARQGDRELGLKVLKRFGAVSVSTLPSEKYAEVIDFCTRGAEKANTKKA